MNTYALDTLTLDLVNLNDTTTNRLANYRTFLSSYNKAYKEICNKRLSLVNSETVTLTNRAFSPADLTYRPRRILYITPDYSDFSSSNSYAMESRQYFEQTGTSTITVPYLNADTCNVTYEYVPDDLVANLVSEISVGNDTPSEITDDSAQEALSYYAAYLHYVKVNKMSKASFMLGEYRSRRNQIYETPAPSDARKIHGVWD